MKKAGRGQGGAFLRAAAKKNQTFSMKRLAKDLEEIEKNGLPNVGVTARPLEHDMYLWHANLKGPEGTPYEGGVFHLEMKIPTSYPHHPPQIRLLTSLPHPNVFNDYICLDMLTLNRG
jgi:ubiquitin-protein ligase